MKRIKVILADDHDIVRFGIASVIRTADDIELIGEASNGKGTLELYRRFVPDVAIVDITMPGMNGIETTRAILEEDPEARILILTMHMDEEYLNQALKAGAKGYLLKNCDKLELVNGIRSIAQGEKVFSGTISMLMTEHYINSVTGPSPDKVGSNEEGVHLTKREKEIINLIADGLTSQEIAEALYISPRTVETHRANLLQKLDIRNTAGLVRFAIENGFIGARAGDS